jgi:outer membrane receptor protein involved in Fe transport
LSKNDFRWAQLAASYAFDINEEWTIQPKIIAQFQRPWLTELVEDSLLNNVQRITASVQLMGKVNSYWNMMYAVEYFTDYTTYEPPTNYLGINWLGRHIQYHNISFSTQQVLETQAGVLTAGLRYDFNDSFGDAWIPWLGFQKKWGKFTTKLMYGQTFRAPLIQNVLLAANGDIKPEITTLIEWENGYQINNHMYASITFFDSQIESPIVYDYEDESIYANYGETGTRGFELEYRLKFAERAYLNSSYTFYNPIHNTIENYDAGSGRAAHLGMATHKWATYGAFQIASKISINPSLLFLDGRYGWTFDTNVPADEDGIQISRKDLGSLFLLNLNLQVEDFLVPHLVASIGVFDVFNQRYGLIQSYTAYASPIPGPAREFHVRFSYKF